MALQSTVGLSTTSTLDGWEIEEYLGPVSAHIVAGTGFFSDLFAGFSDLLGGRSFSYQQQLQSLNAEAMKMLRLNAGRLRANWVVGMSLDMDEVSGKGVQMFMMTASGTAVRARRKERQAASSEVGAGAAAGGKDGTGRVSYEQVRVSLQRAAIRKSIERGELVLNEASWSAIVEGGVAEAAEEVLKDLARAMRHEKEPATLAATTERSLAYFSALGEKVAVDTLYRVVRSNADLANAAILVLRHQQLCDYEAVVGVLRSGEPDEKRRMLQVLEASPQWYTAEDMSWMSQIVDVCRDVNTFSPFGKIEETRGVFGKREEYRCNCGEKRPAAHEYCPDYSCNRDRLGFRRREINPASCAESLETIMRIVRSLL